MSFSFKKPARAVVKVFIHCSASDSPNYGMAEITKDHLKRGFAEIGYHYFIDRNAILHAGRSLSKAPAAQAGHNTGSIAICVAGLTKEKFTKEQMAVLANVCKTINLAYDKKITFHGHREVANKTCPVFDYKAVLGLDAKGYMKS